MSTTQQGTERKGIPPALIIAGLVALMAIAAFLASRAMPRREFITNPDSPNVTWMKKKAVEAQGEVNKLSPADRQHLQEINPQFGTRAIKDYYDDYKAGRLNKK